MSTCTTLLLAALLLASSVGTVACSSKKAASQSAAHQAEDMQGHECAACGMIVRDQPAPRGQLVHNDGTRLFFCSVSDMITYLEAPSPHGKAVAIFAESMDQDSDPLAANVKPQPWLDATTASYVVGFEKQVMGDPILSYSTDANATAKTSQISDEVMDWKALRTWAARRDQ